MVPVRRPWPQEPHATERDQCTTGGLHPTGICEISAPMPRVVSCNRRRWTMRYPRSALVAVLTLVSVPTAWGQPQAELVVHFVEIGQGVK